MSKQGAVMTREEVEQLIHDTLSDALKDLRESAESRHVDHYDTRSVEDHFRNAAADVLVESISLMEMFD